MEAWTGKFDGHCYQYTAKHEILYNSETKPCREIPNFISILNGQTNLKHEQTGRLLDNMIKEIGKERSI